MTGCIPSSPIPEDRTTDSEPPHELLYESGGDGWNEPEGDSWDCSCGEGIATWVQRDPERSGRPDLDDVLHAHAVHVAAELAAVEREAAEAKARIEAVKVLHIPYDCTEAGAEGHETCGEREWCYSCGEDQPWPCMTFQALRVAASLASPLPPEDTATNPATSEQEQR